MEQIFKSDKILKSLHPDKNAAGTTEEETLEQYLIFTLTGKLFAISSNFTKEVGAIDKIYFFPEIDPWIRGLVNIKGDIHSIINLNEILGIESEHEPEMQIIITSDKITTAAAIENIVDVGKIETNLISVYNEDETEQEYFSGIFQWKGKDVVIINIEKIISDLLERIEDFE